jgi:hypothetical protein
VGHDLAECDWVDVGAELDVVDWHSAGAELVCELPRPRLVLVEHEEADVPPPGAEIGEKLEEVRLRPGDASDLLGMEDDAVCHGARFWMIARREADDGRREARTQGASISR